MNGSPDNQENRFVKFLGSRNSITVSGKLYGIGDEDRDALPFSFPESFLVNGKTDCRVVDLFPRFFVVDHRFDSDFENIYADLLRNMERFGAAGEPPFQEHRKTETPDPTIAPQNHANASGLRVNVPKTNSILMSSSPIMLDVF